MLNRIRRTSAWPSAIKSELASRAKYPLAAMLSHRGKNLTLSYRRSRRDPLEPEGRVTHRELFCWIGVDGEERVGALRFDEWEAEPLIGDGDFYDHMDSHSLASVAFGKAVLSSWEADDLSDYGPIAEFSVAWMRPAYSGAGLWAAAARHLISRHYARSHSALILKAFPLEYEGEVPQGSPRLWGLMRRQLAAFRLFRRELGVELLPGLSGSVGWMWKPLRGVGDEPRSIPRIFPE